MFDIIYSLFFDLIDMLKWFIPVLLVCGIIGELIKTGGRR